MVTSYFEEEELHNCKSEIQVLAEDSQVRDKCPKEYEASDNGNTLWWEAVFQEMKSVCLAFDILEKPAGNIPPGYQEIKCNFIFNMNMGEN